MENWLTASLPIIAKTVASVFLVFCIVIAVVRVGGLRTFAKMSSFDFASTIAMGSIIAAVIMNTEQSLLKGAVALGSIVLFQQLFAKVKFMSDWFEDTVENNPILLMDGTTFLEDNMRATGVSRSDLIAKLREANVIRLSEVRAVVLETTGDVTVLHSEGHEELEGLLLEGVTS